MTTLRYAGVCALLVALGAAGAGAFLDRGGLIGVLAAGGAALLIQVSSFALLARLQRGSTAFMAGWVAGTLVRMFAVGLVGWALVVLPDLPPAPTLLGFAAFLFVMLMLETRFLGLGRP